MIRRGVVLAACMILAAPLAVHSIARADAVASDYEDSKRAAKAADLADALGVLKETFDFLASQPHFSFTAVTGHDVVQRGGFKLEFGDSRKVTLMRPDQLRVDVMERDGEGHTTRYDGQRFSVSFPSENAYVSIEFKGSVDAVLDKLREDFDTSIPLSDLLQSSVFDEIAPKIDFAMVVGEAEISGVVCDHVVFRSPAVDVQLWIESEGQPLIRRMIVSYKHAAGSPQFWANIDDWKFGGKAPADGFFSFSPPEGAERIPMRVNHAKGGLD